MDFGNMVKKSIYPPYLDTLGIIHNFQWIAAFGNQKSQNIRPLPLILASFFSLAK
jgi:hypothetical protein